MDTLDQVWNKMLWVVKWAVTSTHKQKKNGVEEDESDVEWRNQKGGLFFFERTTDVSNALSPDPSPSTSTSPSCSPTSRTYWAIAARMSVEGFCLGAKNWRFTSGLAFEEPDLGGTTGLPPRLRFIFSCFLAACLSGLRIGELAERVASIRKLKATG